MWRLALNAPKHYVIDFETEGIEGRPKYPPNPVGVSILKPGAKHAKYWSWGHPEKNNCTFEQGRDALQEVWDSGLAIVAHNAKFDFDVAEVNMGLPALPWDRMHDTMFLLFLDNPYAPDLKLKPSADRLLGMPPEEQDAVKEWVLANVPEMRRGYQWPKLTRWGRKFKKPQWGAYICRAPGDLVGKYAEGDVIRTGLLFKFLWPKIVKAGMLPAYDRERRLMPIILESERQGIRMDLPGALKAHADLAFGKERADNWLRARLRAPDLNIDSDRDLAEALDQAGVVEQWELTNTGAKSVAKDALTPTCFNDQQVAQVLGYRNRADTCMAAMEPWIDMAEASGGRIFTSWNQVKGGGFSGDKGAGTGRLSSQPNFQNIAQAWEDPKSEDPNRFIHPEFLGVPRLPLMRSFILPDEGEVWIKRDYSQQEYRIVAHFAGDFGDGKLAVTYRRDPKTDMHTFVQAEIELVTGLKLKRKVVKTVNFGMLYGMGVGKLAKRLGISLAEAKRIKAAWLEALPDVAEMDRYIKWRGQNGETIRTWGGRVYTVKPAVERDGGGFQTFEYKMLNDLIQGSAADCTKEAVIRFCSVPGPSKFRLTVHDEINLSCPREYAEAEMARLNAAMMSVGSEIGDEDPQDPEKFSVPMLSEGAVSSENWSAIKDWEPGEPWPEEEKPAKKPVKKGKR